MIRVGSIWESVDKRFVVISTAVVDNHHWVNYRNQKTGQEYSCREESFVTRFREVLNEH